MTAQIYVHPTVAGDPAKVEAIQIHTQHIAAHYHGKVRLIPRCKIDMLETVKKMIREFANESH